MNWADAVPNLLIGLREGLEAGLVVSILLAALRKTATGDRRVSTSPVWLGVLGAVMLAGSFAAVLTFSTSVLSSTGQQAVGGTLSVLAVGLVTAMVFWMRRTAATLAKHLRGEVARAVTIGAGALAVTAFLAVAREGLETTLFIWTAVKASGSTVAPLVGAGLGLASAIILCALLYRQAVRLNLGIFFSRTALLLVVIAAGVLSYGLGDLQDAGWLPGSHWVAFDLTAHVDPNSWWVSIISGLTELAPKMTVLQVVAWAVYLAVVVPLFVRAGRTATAPRPAPAPAAAPAEAKPEPAATPAAAPAAAAGVGSVDWWERLAGQRTWTVAGALIVVPVVAATTAISLLPSADSAGGQTVTITGSSCAGDWTAARSGTQTFQIDNKSGKAGEVTLVDSGGAIVGEIETIGPGTTAAMSVTLGNGTYQFKCLMSGQAAEYSASLGVTGASGGQSTATAVVPVTVAQLTPPNDAYQKYAAGILAQLVPAVARIRADLVANSIPAAKNDWLAAQTLWERVGASYDSFGDGGVAVDGLPGGLAGGVNDPAFTGLHRIESGLWSGQTPAQLIPVVDTLAKDVATVQKKLTTDDEAGDPTQLSLRAHEIIEDALRDHLSGVDDLGSGARYAETYADTQVDQVVLGELSALINARAPKLLPTAERQLNTLQTALLATRAADGTWQAPAQVPLAARQDVNAAIGSLLETLAEVPGLLEVPPTH